MLKGWPSGHLFYFQHGKKLKQSAKYLLFCIANSFLFRIFVVQTNKVINLNTMSMKDSRQKVSVHKVTSNGYGFHLKKNGDVSVFCRRNEDWAKNKPLQSAIHEILKWARESNYYLFQWHLEHVY